MGSSNPDPAALISGGTQPHAVFVGREAELALLHSAIEAAANGNGRVVLIGGEPGIGKTRLLQKASEHAVTKANRVVWGRCWEGAGAPAFWPWLQILRSLASPETGTVHLNGIVAELQSMLHRCGLSSLATASDQDRFRFFDTIARILINSSVEQPLILLIDDLHWADKGALLLLQFLTAEIADARICIAATYRDVHHRGGEPVAELLGAVGRQRHGSLIVLPGLNSTEVRALLNSTVGPNSSGQLLAAVGERTEGNPFFLGELAAIITSQHLEASDGSAVRGILPLTVKEVIRKHLSALSVNCSLALELASVQGREFDIEIVSRAVEKPSHEVCALLDEAISLRILEVQPLQSYRFHHALVRETIYDAIPTATRSLYHYKIAKALQDTEAYSTLPMLAYHFCMAIPYGSASDALKYTLMAAMRSRSDLGYEDAVLQYQRALAIADTVSVGPLFHCELLLSLGEAQGQAGSWVESRQTFGKAAAEARMLRQPSLFAKAALGFRGLMGSTIPMDGASVAILREALASLDEDDCESRIRVLNALTYALYFGRCQDDMERYSEEAIAVAESTGDAKLERFAVEARLISLSRPVHLQERADAAAKLVRLADAAADKALVFQGHVMHYAALLEMGDAMGSAFEFESLAALAEESRLSRSRWQSALVGSARALAAGELRDSMRLTESSLELGARVHDSSTLHCYMVQRFQSERIRGKFELTVPIISKAFTQYPGIVGYRVAHAAIRAANGDAHRARGELAVLAASGFSDISGDVLFLWTVGLLVEAAEGSGEPEWWRRIYTLLLPFRDHNVVMSWGVAFDGSAEHFLGMLSGALGEYDRGGEHFEAALAMNTKMGAVPLVARTQERYAALLVQRDGAGDAAHARALLEQAAETMERVGMVGHLARARTTLERLEAARPQVVLPPAAPAGAAEPVVAEAAPRYLFRREGDYWSVAFEGVLVRVRHTRGLALLAVLLQRPESDVHVFDLVSAVEGAPADPEHRKRPRELLAALARDAGPLADQRARGEYRRRAEELRGELAEAEACNDLGRVARLQEETAQLADELQRIYGRGGRSRLPASACERARVNVRNNITYALGALKSAHAGVWRHMKAAVRTGTFCSYQPERAIPWAF